MPPDAALAGLARAIQLAVAPVFLLTGIAALLGVLTNRLARIIDRLRQLEAAPETGDDRRAAREAAEVTTLESRIRRVNQAITFCTYAALLVAGVVALLFVGVAFRVDLTTVVATTFVLAMGALIAGLTSFLAEIHLTTRQWRRTLRRD